MTRSPTLYASFAAFALVTAPNMPSAECGNTTEAYKSSVADVANALRAYAKCVAFSNGHDDCAAEIQALDNAHDNFVDAVADMKDCK